MAKNQSLPAHLQEKDSRGEDNLTTHEYHEKSTAWWPRPSLSSPRSTNDIVWAVLRANPTLLRFVTNRVLTNIFISCNLTDTFYIFITDSNWIYNWVVYSQLVLDSRETYESFKKINWYLFFNKHYLSTRI